MAVVTHEADRSISRPVCSELGMAIAYTFLADEGGHVDAIARTWPDEGDTYEAGLSHAYVETARSFEDAASPADEIDAVDDVGQRLCTELGVALSGLEVYRARQLTSEARSRRNSERWNGIADGLADIRSGYESRLVQHLDLAGSNLASSNTPNQEGSELFVLLACALLRPEIETLEATAAHFGAYVVGTTQALMMQAQLEDVEHGLRVTDSGKQSLKVLLHDVPQF
jgi:hypothetical protein